MSTVFESGRSGLGQTHALVIGVGEYPSCAALAGKSGDHAALARRFPTVSSPVVSAKAVADWLCSSLPNAHSAPLGSVELLTGHVPLEELKKAFDRWFERCDSDNDNVAFFYFSGHGVSYDAQHALLLSDLGQSSLRFFENAVHLEQTWLGMARCRARTQVFFVDACREMPYEIHQWIEPAARSLIEPIFTEGGRDAPIYFSTVEGERAFGERGLQTPFTTAMLEALDGLGAVQLTPGRWEVRTDGLVRAINHVLKLNYRPGDPSQVATVGGSHGDSVLRVLDAAPMVPFRLGTQPREALPSASLSLIQARLRTTVAHRAPAAALWQDSARADWYELHASFADGSYQNASVEWALAPPCWIHDLLVEPQ